MFYFCTYFDQYYLVRGLALYRSLRNHCPEFRLWVLCLDDITYQTITEHKFPGIYPIALEEFERDDESLKIAKTNRSQIEYYFTCTPSLPLYILNHWPEVDLITYLDADLFFFSSPVPLFEEMAGASIAIIGHRFPPKVKHLEMRGVYNVGWLSFRRDANGFACLQWWRDRCTEWCYDRVENGRFADQKYLDDWPRRFQNIIVLEHKGANLALWNLQNYHLQFLNRSTVTVDDYPLVFFHFHGLTKINKWLYDPGCSSYGVTPTDILHRRIYMPYIEMLLGVRRQLMQLFRDHPIIAGIRPQSRLSNVMLSPKGVINLIRRWGSIGKGILLGKYLFCVNRRVF